MCAIVSCVVARFCTRACRTLRIDDARVSVAAKVVTELWPQQTHTPPPTNSNMYIFNIARLCACVCECDKNQDRDLCEIIVHHRRRRPPPPPVSGEPSEKPPSRRRERAHISRGSNESYANATAFRLIELEFILKRCALIPLHIVCSEGLSCGVPLENSASSNNYAFTHSSCRT